MLRTCRFLSLSLMVSLTILAASPAKAGLLLEPYLGYKMGTYTASNASVSLSAPQIGARLGVTFPLIFVALDYSTLLSGTFSSGTNGAPNGDAAESQLFAEVGVSLPLLRAYAGYAVLNTLDYKPTGTDNKAEGGTGFKLGVGTTMLPLIAINVEYVHTDYDKLNGGTTSGVSSNLYSLNVSIPFNL